jgi:excisionase family DNA binding protein
MAGRPTTQIDFKAERLAVSVGEAAEAAGVSRSSLYEEMRAGRLRYVKVRTRRVILVADLRDWLFSLRAT